MALNFIAIKKLCLSEVPDSIIDLNEFLNYIRFIDMFG